MEMDVCLYSIIVFDLSVEYEGVMDFCVLVCFLFFTIVLFL